MNQMETRYFIKRVDEVAEQKIRELCGDGGANGNLRFWLDFPHKGKYDARTYFNLPDKEEQKIAKEITKAAKPLTVKLSKTHVAALVIDSIRTKNQYYLQVDPVIQKLKELKNELQEEVVGRYEDRAKEILAKAQAIKDEAVLGVYENAIKALEDFQKFKVRV